MRFAVVFEQHGKSIVAYSFETEKADSVAKSVSEACDRFSKEYNDVSLFDGVTIRIKQEFDA